MTADNGPGSHFDSLTRFYSCFDRKVSPAIEHVERILHELRGEEEIADNVEVGGQYPGKSQAMQNIHNP
jgi:hypothetical protein